jgi:hypothetical protein
MNSWVDMLLDLLCRIYQEYGGDCKDLYNNPANAPQKVVSEYTTNGAPTFSNQDELDAFLQTLTDLETALASEENSLPQSDTDALTNMIAGLRSALGGS